ncbi:MAG: hypothetical protein J0H68_01440 [Sphingobacteriia bacterium]|nr:hypothetical protein [Sphingobacteriia bacterium]
MSIFDKKSFQTVKSTGMLFAPLIAYNLGSLVLKGAFEVLTSRRDASVVIKENLRKAPFNFLKNLVVDVVTLLATVFNPTFGRIVGCVLPVVIDRISLYKDAPINSGQIRRAPQQPIINLNTVIPAARANLLIENSHGLIEGISQAFKGK